ncbi:hypothetical protein FRC18_004737 [Serendipita sp. 400]|nr:hypothetical protein FRC18_004737 [Serendipita sp. 400]
MIRRLYLRVYAAVFDAYRIHIQTISSRSGNILRYTEFPSLGITASEQGNHHEWRDEPYPAIRPPRHPPQQAKPPVIITHSSFPFRSSKLTSPLCMHKWPPTSDSGRPGPSSRCRPAASAL